MIPAIHRETLPGSDTTRFRNDTCFNSTSRVPAIHAPARSCDIMSLSPYECCKQPSKRTLQGVLTCCFLKRDSLTDVHWQSITHWQSNSCTSTSDIQFRWICHIKCWGCIHGNKRKMTFETINDAMPPPIPPHTSHDWPQSEHRNDDEIADHQHSMHMI